MAESAGGEVFGQVWFADTDEVTFQLALETFIRVRVLVLGVRVR